MPATVNTYRTHAPKSNPHPDPRGVAIDAPYDETFIYRLKQLPDWCYEWRGRDKVWVVDAPSRRRWTWCFSLARLLTSKYSTDRTRSRYDALQSRRRNNVQNSARGAGEPPLLETNQHR